MSFDLILCKPLLQALLDHAQAELPNECCGLLAGRIEQGNAGCIGRVVKHYPLLNAAASPVEFEGEPRSQLTAHKDMDREGLELLAVYHSHPTSPPLPSKKDRERSFDESVMSLIISLTTDPPVVQGWWLTPESHRPAEWRVE